MYMLNYQTINPAATAIEDYAQVQIGGRRQWTGISGAPVTNYLNAFTPLKMKGRDRFTTAWDVENNEVQFTNHGIGLNLYHDKIGPYNTTNATVAYAMHLPIAAKLALSMGVSAGVQLTNFDPSKSILPEQSVDPALISQYTVSQKINPDLNAGVMVSSSRYFLGLSYLQIIPSTFIDAEKGNSKYKPMLLASGGYGFDLDESGLSLWLSGVVKSDFANPVRVDVAAKARYRELCWLGVNYRKEDAIGIGLGWNPIPQVMMAYNYDHNLNAKFRAIGSASHEISIGWRFLSDDQDSRPRMRW